MIDLLLESALRSLALGAAVWLGLTVLRVRNPRAQMTAWTVVLAAALAMPALMGRVTVTLPAAAPPLHVVEQLLPRSAPLPGRSVESTAPAPPMQGADAAPHASPALGTSPAPAAAADSRALRPGAAGTALDWRMLAAAVYLAVAGVMLLRLVTGLLLGLRIARAALPVREHWARGAGVRVSDTVPTPVTFGSLVLLPATHAGWSEAKRQAVLAHEFSHVAHGDFYVLLVAAFHRAVFWFNPLAWWQLRRMAELAEIISDDDALEMLSDRTSYAGILLDLAGGLREARAAIAMARACTLRRRVERILTGGAVPARIGWRQRMAVAIALAPAVIVAAGAAGPGATTLPAAEVASLPAVSTPGATAHPLDRYAGYFELGPLRVLAVTPTEDRLIVQETGSRQFEVTAHGDEGFVARDGSMSVVFTAATADRTELELREPGTRAQRAVRVDAARAQEIESAFARRIAAAPDRFRDQLPADGSKDVVLRALDEWQREAPDYDRMSSHLADRVHHEIAQLHAMKSSLGTVEAAFFRGVSPGGFDIYGIKFAHGLAEFRILARADGTMEDMTFRPDGDGTPGEVTACGQEQALRSVPGAIPIQMWVYNDTGAEIRITPVDSEGRSADVAIGDDRSSLPILTAAGSPWIVTDAAGQCLEVIVPGMTTRHVVVPADARKQANRPAPRRTSPIPGSEQALRRYIDALRRGEPDYDGMTPQIAAYTREELALHRAILARLGTLRALSFRGVTWNGNDIYTAHFADGSADWRIGLVKEGRIGRMALGPQY